MAPGPARPPDSSSVLASSPAGPGSRSSRRTCFAIAGRGVARHLVPWGDRVDMWRAASNLWGDKGSLAGMRTLFTARGGRHGLAHSGRPFEDKAMGLYLKRLPRAFRRLHWRFALSYMLVTVCSVALVPATYFIASYLFVVRSPNLPRDMAAGLEPVASPTLAFLVHVPSRPARLPHWLGT